MTVYVHYIHTYVYIYIYTIIYIYMHTEERLVRAEAMAAGRDHRVANDHVNMIFRCT